MSCVNILGQTFFSSRIVRVCLTPILIAFVIFISLAVEKWTLSHTVLVLFLYLVCIALLCGFWLPERYSRWAYRIVAGIVFLAYTAYLIDERSMRAFRGFIIIGVPCLLYLVV